ncbi:MAG: RnfABCDGE type electron transport complex subunit G [Nitrospiraceae bacterium]|nr:RnfABCDGE type electron transport complex subunit G [Nitrospiraceae bacterium]
MREMLKITFSLVIIFVIAGFIMASVFAITAPVIKEKKEQEETLARKAMMPDADAIVEAGEWKPFGKKGKYFEGKKNGETIGYLITTYGKGYSSYINVLVSVDKEMKVKGISILGHGETPGLGDEIEQEYFKKRFESKMIDQLEVVKVEGTDKIQAISGATISSRAVTNSVKDAVKLLKEKYSGAKNEQ